MKFIALATTAAAIAVAAPSAALAGPYVNLETKSKFEGTDYGGSTSHLHAGWSEKLGSNTKWYIQVGPALITPDGEPAATEFSGKTGLKTKITDNLKGYVEVSFITQDQGGNEYKYGTKAGLTYSF